MSDESTGISSDSSHVKSRASPVAIPDHTASNTLQSVTD